MRTWFQGLRKAQQPQRTRSRLALERLEERCLLSSQYVQTNLVSDIAGMAASTDTDLVNPWGLAASPTGPWWVNDNGTGLSTLYNGNTGAKLSLVVTIPPPAGGSTAAPTGMVFNGTSDFQVAPNDPAFFIFATEDGTISGWNPAVNLTNAVLEVDNSGSGAVYKGLAMGSNAGGNYLFATNFHAGTVDVFNASFQQVNLSGSFTDPHLPPNYAPFGIQNVNGNLYISYAVQNAEKHDDVAGMGHGLIDVYDTNGNLLQRLVNHGQLNSPWGMAIAPSNFGDFSNDLLVGNFGNGRINAYDPNTGEFLGKVRGTDGNPISIDGLWGLRFGNDHAAGPSTTLFFTAGINHEADGLFGTLTLSSQDHQGDALVGALTHQRDAGGKPTAVQEKNVVVTVSPQPGPLSGIPAPSNLTSGQPQPSGSGLLRTAHTAAVDLAFEDFKLNLLI
jgi:uncharacterized protein (TIGR03118 family)